MRFFVCGIDEAGRGPLAGPVTAACVCLPHDFEEPTCVDSKKLTEKSRERLYSVITRVAIAYAVVSVGPRRIERWNILESTKEAMRLAARRVSYRLHALHPEARPYFLVDGNATLGTTLLHETIVRGDDRIVAISAASILAKVSRDRLMCLLDARYPGFGLGAHKGYGTVTHRERIKELGPCRIHRRTFMGVREHCVGPNLWCETVVESGAEQTALFDE